MEFASRGYVLHVPCKMLVRDLYISDEIYSTSVPEVTFELPNPAARTGGRSSGMSGRISRLDLTSPIEQLAPGTRGFNVSRFPQHRDVLSSVFERIGQDPRRFRGYRCTMSYPLPFIEMLWWISLPEPPVD
jgi:hypothetical protein